MDPDVWHQLGDLFEPSLTLADGFRVFQSPGSAGAFPDLLTLGEAGELLLRLQHVPLTDIDNLPPLEQLAPAMIREDLVALPSARFGWDLELRTPDTMLHATGLVTAELLLTATVAGASIPRDKQTEIETAFERGLLDRQHHHIADFRLRMRAVRDQLAAIRHSGFVPDWRVSVLFSRFYNPVDDDWPATPLAKVNWPTVDVRLTPRERQRGFRVADLFQGAH